MDIIRVNIYSYAYYSSNQLSDDQYKIQKSCMIPNNNKSMSLEKVELEKAMKCND